MTASLTIAALLIIILALAWLARRRNTDFVLAVQDAYQHGREDQARAERLKRVRNAVAARAAQLAQERAAKASTMHRIQAEIGGSGD